MTEKLDRLAGGCIVLGTFLTVIGVAYCLITGERDTSDSKDDLGPSIYDRKFDDDVIFK